MKNIPAFFLVLLALLHIPVASRAQLPETGESNARPIPEIKRLYEAFAGDWDTSEQRERTQLFPNGGERKGRTHVRLAAGGALLAMEGHSDGSAGQTLRLLHLLQGHRHRLSSARHGALGSGQVCERLRRGCGWQEDEVSRRVSRYHPQLLHAGLRVDQRRRLDTTRGYHQSSAAPLRLPRAQDSDGVASLRACALNAIHGLFTLLPSARHYKQGT
jgi:hypothetical protein